MNRRSAKILATVAGITSASFILRGKFKSALWAAAPILPLLGLAPSRYGLVGRVAVISGGSRGLGLALARAFLKAGSKVALLARDEEELERAKHLLLSEFGTKAESDILTIPCNVINSEELQEALSVVQSRFRGINIFINNAGSMVVGPFETMGDEDFESQMNIHLYAAIRTTRALLPIFKNQNDGRIVNISSIGGKIAVPHMTPYCASKFALSGFSQALQTELRKSNVRVTTIYPGLMRTGSVTQAVFKGSHEKEYAWFSLLGLMPGIAVSPDGVAERILEAIREGESEVVISPLAKLAVFAHYAFGELFIDISSLINRFLPKGNSKRRKTGSASQRWMEENSWFAPLRKQLGYAKDRYNERDGFDARFNMNLDS